MGDNSDWRGIVVLSLLFGIIGFLVYMSFNASFKFGLLVIANIFVLALSYFRHWGTIYSLPIRLKPLFRTASGTVGRLIRGPEPGHSGMVTYIISTHKAYIPKNRLKERNWIDILGDTLSGAKTIEVTDHPSKFIELPRQNLEVSEGVIEYLGRLDGGPVIDQRTILVEQINRLSTTLTQVNTQMEMAYVQAANYAKQHILGMDQMSQNLKTITDRVKRVMIIPKGGGSEAMADVEGGN